MTSVPLRTSPLLALHEFVVALHELLFKGDEAPFYITVPVVKFVYLCPDFYKMIRDFYAAQSQLRNVFQVLDLVVSESDFEDMDSKEAKACATFAFLNNVKVLKFLWNRGFFWDEKTLFAAINSKSVECVKFALKNDCPLTSVNYSQLVPYLVQFNLVSH